MCIIIFVMKDLLEALKGQQVEVVYNGLIYRGRLSGASEREIYLETSEERLSLPMEHVSSVQRASGGTGFEGYTENSADRFRDFSGEGGS